MVNTQTATLKLTSLRSLAIAMAFVAGNIIVPQLCHLVPGGGLMWLPIYFFTLVGAYRYGWQVGLLTAVVSPLVNSLLFGMPAIASVPVIEIKSLLLALTAAVVAARVRRVTLAAVILTVAAAFMLGGAFEWAYTGSLASAIQDFVIGWPGLLLQAFGGWAVLKLLR